MRLAASVLSARIELPERGVIHDGARAPIIGEQSRHRLNSWPQDRVCRDHHLPHFREQIWGTAQDRNCGPSLTAYRNHQFAYEALASGHLVSLAIFNARSKASRHASTASPCALYASSELGHDRLAEVRCTRAHAAVVSPQVVALAYRHPVVSEDRVSRGDVEIEILRSAADKIVLAPH